MNHRLDLPELLAQELKRVPAPEDLWARVQAGIHRRPAPASRNRAAMWTWAAVAVVIAIALLIPAGRLRPDQPLDLQGYLTPVQDASEATSVPAIYRAPRNFATVESAGPKWMGAYSVAVQRLGKVDGEQVKQVVLSSPDDTAAVFIAPPKVRLNAGSNTWVASNLEGVACQRLNCPRVRTVQFPCAPQVCVIVCKACSEKVMTSLMEQVMARAQEFR